MPYQVFARKTRPRNFSEVVGQEHVLRALSNGLEQGRVHHAFLFTGTRGVGKTTIARIFAKALNCETGVTANPCGHCSACEDIDAGRYIDLIEIDAASRTGVDDIRELIDNVQYAPTRGRSKVYLIDEVHMLSNSAFNALLKTLEEPPAHVKFLLATTDPQKLPVTVLSRCLQFNLKRVPSRRIAAHLQAVLQADDIAFDVPALAMIARAAEGSIRDSLSLLDQAVAFGAGSVNEADVRDMLGTLEKGDLAALLTYLCANQPTELFAVVEKLEQQGANLGNALAELVTALQRAALYQTVPDAVSEDEPAYRSIIATADALSAADIQLFYQIALQGRSDTLLAPDPRTGFEMTLLRMLAFSPISVGSGVQPAKKSIAAATRPPVSESEKPAAADTEASPGLQAEQDVLLPEVDAEEAEARLAEVLDAALHVASSDPLPAAQDIEAEWAALVESLNVAGLARQLAMHCVPVEGVAEGWVLKVDAEWNALASDVNIERVTQALHQQAGRKITVRFELAALPEVNITPAKGLANEAHNRMRDAELAISADPIVKTLIERFGATIREDSVRPLGIEESENE